MIAAFGVVVSWPPLTAVVLPSGALIEVVLCLLVLHEDEPAPTVDEQNEVR